MATLPWLSQRWDASKSEVIRRALRIALITADDSEGTVTPDALTRLQRTVRERGVDLTRWGEDVAAERATTGRRRWRGSE